jgi:predicted dehydrogenase
MAGSGKLRIGAIALSFSDPYIYAELLPHLGARIDYVWDYYPDRAAEYAAKHDVQIVQDYHDFATLPVDGVMIFSPGADHIKHAEPLVEARVPVYVDRPMSTDFRSAERLYARARERGTMLMSCHAIRYESRFARMASRMRSGEMGKPLSVLVVVSHTMRYYMEIPRNRWHDRIEEGGGMIIDIGVIGMEVLHATLGLGAETVSCTRSKVHFLDADSEDCALITVAFVNGAVGGVQIICAYEDFFVSLDAWGTKEHAYVSVDLEGLRRAERNSGKAILDAFRTGVSPIPDRETLEITKILCAARIAAGSGTTIKLANL